MAVEVSCTVLLKGDFNSFIFGDATDFAGDLSFSIFNKYFIKTEPDETILGSVWDRLWSSDRGKVGLGVGVRIGGSVGDRGGRG